VDALGPSPGGVRSSLADEAARWCAAHDEPGHPRRGLHAERIAPTTPWVWLTPEGGPDGLAGHLACIRMRQDCVREVVEARRIDLTRTARPGDRPRGRYLLVVPEVSLDDGGAQTATDGFFDESEIPPRGCWVAHVAQGEAALRSGWTRSGGGHTDVLVAWIPEVLMPVVERGMAQSIGEPFAWSGGPGEGRAALTAATALLAPQSP
jgi:hypothetical protein